jgi:GT2 family glycosyltransferase
VSRVFKNSKRFNRYHAGHIKEDQSAPTDVLSGAFMFIRKEALDKVGLLDESFFMYGEDIDLSYRITLGGYTNHYFADSTIIHYKGESTKKSSVNYVFVFYRAMIIFARKHFSQNYAFLFSVFIHIGIYVRASMSIGKRVASKTMPMVWNGGIGILGLYGLAEFWKTHDISFPSIVYYAMIPSYWMIWSLTNL